MRKTRALLFGGLGSVVAYLAFVEFTSGIIQGYYTPFMSDIARHLDVTDADVNWLEGAQLMLSALVVPTLSKLGDMIGHRRMLLLSTAVTFFASVLIAVAPVFWLFLIAWSLQGFYVVWLPLEIALIYIRSRELSADAPAALTRRAAGVLVAALELGAIAGALTGGALIDALPLRFVLTLPAVVVGACWVVIAVGVRETERRPGPAGFDTIGLFIVTGALILLMGSLFVLRGSGIDVWSGGFWTAVAMLLLGVIGLYAFARFELRHPDPVIDVRMFADPAMWPVFATAGLFGMSVLGAQAPLSTFARTDPDLYGFGLGTSGFATSLIIGLYLIAMTVGAMLVPLASRLTTPRWALVMACLLVGIGYGMFLPMHDHYGQVIANMAVAGLGSGALVASLPAAAAAAATVQQTGVATGLTNSVKTVGGAVASCIFGLALSSFAASAGTVPDGTAGSYTGYLTVWTVCSVTAIAAAVLLMFVPKHAFGDRIAPVAA